MTSYKSKIHLRVDGRTYAPGDIVDEESLAALDKNDLELVEGEQKPQEENAEGGEQSNAVEGRETKPAKNVKKK